jgi:hypothetical protein
MVALRRRTILRLVDTQGFPAVAAETPNANRSQTIFGTREISSNPEIKFPADDGLELVNSIRSSCSSAEAYQTASTAKTVRDCSANEVAIATIWVFFFALLIGLSTITPLLSGAINLTAHH